MKKIILIILIMFMVLSCSNSKTEISDLKTQIATLEEKQLTDNLTIKNLKKLNTENEQQIEDLKFKISELNSNSIYQLTNDEYSFDSFLVTDGFSLLPNGFIKSKGYIADMRDMQVRENISSDMLDISSNYGSLVFFVTDKDSEIYNFLSKVENNNLIYRDENRNICIPIVEDSNINSISWDVNYPSDVILTLHRMPNMALENSVIPFASIYNIK